LSEKVEASQKTLKEKLRSNSFWAMATHLSPQRQILVVSLGDANKIVEGLATQLKKQAVDRNDIDEEWENSGCESWEEVEKLRKKKFVSLVGVLEVLR